jgi:Cu/Ag efflux protein CusF
LLASHEKGVVIPGQRGYTARVPVSSNNKTNKEISMKSFIRNIALIAIAAALLGAPAGATAQDKAKEKAAEKAKGEEKAKGGGFNGKAVTVDKAAKTVKLSGEKGRTIQITATTKIVKDGKPATLDDLKEGDDVSGGFKPAGDGKLEATMLTIGKPAPKKKEDKK